MYFWATAFGVSAESPARDFSRPQRVVSINLCADELALRMLPRGNIAALSFYSARSEDSTIETRARGIPRTHGTLEEILSYRPDLVLAGDFTRPELRRGLGRFGIPVAMFEVPKSIGEIYSLLEKAGRLFGAEEDAARMIRELQASLAQIPSFARKPGIIFYQTHGYSPGAGTFENSIIEAAGGFNLAAAAGITDYGQMDLEKLVGLKPELVVFASDQMQNRTAAGELLRHPVFRSPHAAAGVIETFEIPSRFLHCGSAASIEAVTELNRRIAVLAGETIP
ncbi:Periplasmic binding protein [sediment metagenome]|uniref:Periplasmic binding protein n=1 Tax=sediment metagenome TaxID=749907 RepID=D9PFT9_9ZZZZ